MATTILFCEAALGGLMCRADPEVLSHKALLPGWFPLPDSQWGVASGDTQGLLRKTDSLLMGGGGEGGRRALSFYVRLMEILGDGCEEIPV